MKDPIKVIFATGQGRLHLFETASSVRQAGCDVEVITGWVPDKMDGLLVRIISRIVARNVEPGLRMRRPADRQIKVDACAFPEFLDQFRRLLCRVFGISQYCFATASVSFLGWWSKRYIKNAQIFHVRTSAGQGGAIRKAHKLGMKVVADQSALHPRVSYELLKDEYARWNKEVIINPDRGVWVNVEKDCREADVILVNADHIKDSYVQQGYSPEKIRVAYLGVREDFFGLKKEYSSSGRLRILYTGGFTLLKGAQYFLMAMATLKRLGVDYECTVIGSSDEVWELREKYCDLPIRYIGPIPQDELKRHLADADIYLFPSLADGCAKSAVEAMAAGLCLIATRTSGAPMKDGETAYVVPAKDANAIVERIQYLNENRQEIERVGRAAAAYAKSNLTWKAYGEKVRHIYEELLAE